jgi:cellulose synthase/poly-beta-1,6-N-acetylglucosamine synthase-like glycosyltransferase
MSRVSVIIPTHDRAHVVGDAIDSVLGQTCRDFEVIVVDDGSTDDTGEVVGRYAASNTGRVVCLRQENAGAPAARNAGMRAASSDYVTFLDSDDLYLPRRLEVGVGLLEANPEFGASYVDQRTVGADGSVLLESRIHRYGGAASGWILPALLRGDLIQTNTITIRRHVLEQVGGFDEKLWSGQDTDLWWRLAAQWQIIGWPERLVVVRELESSLSRGRGSKGDRLRRLSVWIEGQGKYLETWQEMPFHVQRLLARRIWDLHHEKACLLSELGRSGELPAVQAQMRELESRYRLPLHVFRRRLGKLCPQLQALWVKVRGSVSGPPAAPPEFPHTTHW